MDAWLEEQAHSYSCKVSGSADTLPLRTTASMAAMTAHFSVGLSDWDSAQSLTA